MSPRAAFAAIAASTAEPPCWRTSSAICVASGWLVAAMPCVARTSERVANGSPVMRSPAVDVPAPSRERVANARATRAMETSDRAGIQSANARCRRRAAPFGGLRSRNARAGGNQWLRVPRVEGDLLSEGPPGLAVPRALRRAVRHRRDQRHLLPAPVRLDRRGVGARRAAGLPLLAEGVAADHAHQALARRVERGRVPVEDDGGARRASR